MPDPCPPLGLTGKGARLERFDTVAQAGHPLAKKLAEKFDFCDLRDDNGCRR
jgi:hypothetical protein